MKEAFERLYVRASGNHVHRNGNPGVVAIVELSEDGLGILGRLICDLLAELVAL